MNCESVEPLFSDYIDGILDPSSTFGLQAHLRFCPDCRATLAGMSQVCMALHGLGGTSPPASFKLQLSNRLQEELHRRRWAWKPPMAWGLALAAALSILLWPETEAERAEVVHELHRGHLVRDAAQQAFEHQFAATFVTSVEAATKQMFAQMAATVNNGLAALSAQKLQPNRGFSRLLGLKNHVKYV